MTKKDRMCKQDPDVFLCVNSICCSGRNYNCAHKLLNLNQDKPQFDHLSWLLLKNIYIFFKCYFPSQ